MYLELPNFLRESGKENISTNNRKRPREEEESIKERCSEIFQSFEDLIFDIFTDSEQVLTRQIPNQITELLQIADPKDVHVKEMRKNICELFRNAYLQKLQFFKEDFEKEFPKLAGLIKKDDTTSIKKLVNDRLVQNFCTLKIAPPNDKLETKIREFRILDEIINKLPSATPKAIDVIAHAILTKVLDTKTFENEETKDAWKKANLLLIPSCKSSLGIPLSFDENDSELRISSCEKKLILMKYIAPQFDHLFPTK